MSKLSMAILRGMLYVIYMIMTCLVVLWLTNGTPGWFDLTLIAALFGWMISTYWPKTAQKTRSRHSNY